MNVLTKYIVAFGLLILGSWTHLNAMGSIDMNESIEMNQDKINSSVSNSIHGAQLNKSRNSSNLFSFIFEIEEEEDKFSIKKKNLRFFSFFLAYIWSQESDSSILEDDITVNFNKANTQTGASKCVILQVFRI